MKVKNVIRGLQREYDLQEINIISQAESEALSHHSKPPVRQRKAVGTRSQLLPRPLPNQLDTGLTRPPGEWRK